MNFSTQTNSGGCLGDDVSNVISQLICSDDLTPGI